MKLNYKIKGQGQPMLLLHGLFGDLDNLGVLSRAFNDSYQVIQVDLRNHGQSPWSNDMNYLLIANDIIELVEDLAMSDLIVIGHSMGGKVAMKLTELIPNKLNQVIILDIAPTAYTNNHRDVFKAINLCDEKKLSDKKQIQLILENSLPFETVQFLLKSYKEEQWQFNYKAIANHYVDICGWQDLPAYFSPILFLQGAQSDYITDNMQIELQQQFPYAQIETIDKAGHNIHFDNPKQVIEEIKRFIC